jgi:hypothetical protein
MKRTGAIFTMGMTMEQIQGQISFFDSEKQESKRPEDMTNLEFMRTLKAEDLVRFIFEKTDYMCLQQCNKRLSHEIWEINCRSGRYGGIEGCDQCRIDWLNSKVGAREKELQEQAAKRKEEMDRLKST